MQQFDSTSWSLIYGTAAAVPADREEFGRRYGPMVSRYFSVRWRLQPNDERIADASQEVFVRIFSPGGPLARVNRNRPNGFRPFLRGVLRNVACELERERTRQQCMPFDENLASDSSQESAADAFDRVWAEMITDAAWELMRNRSADSEWARRRVQILGMRYVDGTPCEAIAESLPGLDVHQVYRLLAAGRSQFRNALMTVLSAHHPNLTREELDQKCREVVDAL